jgi:hypothetical protein
MRITHGPIHTVLLNTLDNCDILILYDREQDVFIVRKWRWKDENQISLFVYNAKEMKSIYNWL